MVKKTENEKLFDKNIKLEVENMDLKEEVKTERQQGLFWLIIMMLVVIAFASSMWSEPYLGDELCSDISNGELTDWKGESYIDIDDNPILKETSIKVQCRNKRTKEVKTYVIQIKNE